MDTSGPNEVSDSVTNAPKLRLLTWNIDAFGDQHESRVGGILSEIQQTHAANSDTDIVFFQEVSRKALESLLQNEWVQETWISSEADETNWEDVPFATMTLLSRSRFGAICKSNTSDGRNISSCASTKDSNHPLSPGCVWRVKYPSRFNRDALCCDILWNSTARIRLVNVHLDSLPIQPSQRPRQVSIAADLLRTAGVSHGVIAGDWNPVMEEDKDLVRTNGLIDAWEHLHPDKDGFTWGLGGKGAPFPPSRLDKVAVLGLRPLEIRVIHPRSLSSAIDHQGESMPNGGKEDMPWSDHSGLFCSLGLGDTQR